MSLEINNEQNNANNTDNDTEKVCETPANGNKNIMYKFNGKLRKQIF